jgi:hypothetical protein
MLCLILQIGQSLWWILQIALFNIPGVKHLQIMAAIILLFKLAELLMLYKSYTMSYLSCLPIYLFT